MGKVAGIARVASAVGTVASAIRTIRGPQRPPPIATATRPYDVDTAVKSFITGSKAFKQTIDPYISTHLKALSDAAEVAAPYSATAFDATNELRQLMGLPPLSRTMHIADKYDDIADRLSVSSPHMRDYSDDVRQLATKFRSAEDAQNPEERQVMFDDAILAAKDRESFLEEVSEGVSDAAPLNELRAEIGGLRSEFAQNFSVDPVRGMQPQDIQKRLEQTPGYQFRFGQGMQALERSQAARGGLLSGGAMLEAQRFGQGLEIGRAHV
mgnify:CR=1 FL=1